MRIYQAYLVTFVIIGAVYALWCFTSHKESWAPLKQFDRQKISARVPIHICNEGRMARCEPPHSTSGIAVPQQLPPKPQRRSAERPQINAAAPGAVVTPAQMLVSFESQAASEARRWVNEGQLVVLLLRVDERDRVSDVLIADRGHLQRKNSTIEEIRQSFPLESHFWIRFPMGQLPFEPMINEAMRRHGLKAADFRNYLLLSQKLTQRVQQSLNREADRRKIAREDVSFAEVQLRVDPIGVLHALVKELHD